MIEPVSEGIFCIRKPFQLGGLELGVRATFVRLGDGKLWLVSPVDFSEEDVNFISSQGRVAAVVAPNLFHHLYLKQAKQRFPEAQFFYAPGLDQKRSHFSFDGPALAHPWSLELSECLLEGMPRFNEVVYFHKASRSLIVTDLFFNLQQIKGWRGQLISRMMGTYNRPAVSRLFRLMMKDKHKVKNSLKTILSWDFERVIMAHGEILEKDCKQICERLLAPLLVD